MKNKIALLALFIVMLLIAACNKDKVDNTPLTNYPNYTQLKVGNYWIYERFEIDTLGNTISSQNIFDSAYIQKDTLINSLTYFKLLTPNQFANVDILFLRDSLHYLVNSKGKILFSSQDFTTIFSSSYTLINSDTVCLIEEKMTDNNTPFSTPSGTFTTANFKATYNMYPNFTWHGTQRYCNTRYAQNVGLVS